MNKLFTTIKKHCQSTVLRLRRLALRDKLILCGIFTFVTVAVILVIALPRSRHIDADVDLTAHDDNGLRSQISATQVPPTPTNYVSPAPTPEDTRNPGLKQGISSNYVTSLQNRLMELGYLDIDEPTMYYGSQTSYSVQIFQRQHSLEMDGVAGKDTLSLLFSDEAEHYVMKEGITGLDVENLQQQLKMLGYYLVSIDGHYGASTKKAVRDFQARNGLNADGLAGERTIEKLFSPNAVAAAWMVQSEVRRANIQKMVDTAYAQLGKPYILGAIGPNAYDCSGLVYYCLRQAGSTRGRYNAAGYASVSEWEKLTNIDRLNIGDLLFFYNNSYSKIGHVGIYVGNGMMIDASANNGKVVYRTCRSYYWRSHFAWGRRPW